MPHSHLRFQHFLKNLETSGSTPRSNRELRPDWLFEFVDCITEFFDPSTDVARAGFECRLADRHWEVGVYLGKTEIVGGRDDGSARVVNFQFDLQQLFRTFDSIERFEWQSSHPEDGMPGSGDVSRVLLEGHWRAHPVCLILHSIPPEAAGPGLRRYPDGRCEPT